ncbi:MAG: Spy/CpxP family protein refolding chaperone [Moraxellaceae bacterium]|nr:Spy/CpxP family protein refolding chaperone [Moraxellaceae bacterium]MBS9779887.1 Spy/CpxP family protein refolding chaperone [Moraxellaceae bacterium]
MKNKLIATVLATGMAMTTGTAFAGGQQGHKNAQFGKHGGMHMQMRIYKKIGLTKQQKQQIKAILEKEKPNRAEMRKQRKAHRQAQQQLIQSATLNEYELNKLAEQTAQQVKQRFIKRIRLQNQIWQILTPEQRQKVIKRQNKKHGKRHN